MPSQVLITETTLDDLGDQTRRLAGTDTEYKPAQMVTALATVPDTTDADATAGDILSGKTAYVNRALVTGAMVDRGAVTATLSGTTHSYTIPAGYHDGTGTVTADVATLAEVKTYLNIT